MAQQTRRSNGKKSAKKPAQRKASSARRNPAPQDPGITAGDIWNMFKDSKFFAPVVTIVAIFDLLFSWNNFELFFKILGVELILAFTVWIINLMVSLGRDKKNTDSYSDEV